MQFWAQPRSSNDCSTGTHSCSRTRGPIAGSTGRDSGGSADGGIGILFCIVTYKVDEYEEDYCGEEQTQTQSEASQHFHGML